MTDSYPWITVHGRPIAEAPAYLRNVEQGTKITVSGGHYEGQWIKIDKYDWDGLDRVNHWVNIETGTTANENDFADAEGIILQ